MTQQDFSTSLKGAGAAAESNWSFCMGLGVLFDPLTIKNFLSVGGKPNFQDWTTSTYESGWSD
jgi:hypothetical protein